MSRLAEVLETLEAEYVDRWGDVPTMFDNKNFKQPEGEWVRFQVLFGDSQNVLNCGDHLTYRQAGVAQLYIYVPHNKGARRAYEIADEFRAIFANQTIGDIIMRSGFTAPPNKESNWYTTRVSIPFEYDTK